MEVSFQNGLLCLVVILEQLAPVLIFWKYMNLLYSLSFLSKYNLLYHTNYQGIEGYSVLMLHIVLLGDFFT